jgi:DNA helicase IV
VALHRVAYLLYTHPQLARRGVLVLGPHPRFLQYVSGVLPSLGETDVEFATPGELFPGLATDVEETSDTARAKGSLATAEVIAAAVADREEVPGEPIPIELDDVTVEITAEIATAAREPARARGLRHNEARPVFAKAVLDALAEQAVDRIGPGWLAPREAPELAVYVALTRATQRLGVLHTEPLPASLRRLSSRRAAPRPARTAPGTRR